MSESVLCIQVYVIITIYLRQKYNIQTNVLETAGYIFTKIRTFKLLNSGISLS